MKALILGLSILLCYTIPAVNTIAQARLKYVATFVSASLFMAVNFFVLKHVADATTVGEFIGYCVGGVGGDLLGIYISKRFRI